jgi:hypothetical protein
MSWTEPQRNDLFYHINRICRVMDMYGIGTRDPKRVCDALEDMLSSRFAGDDVVVAVKAIIQRTGRIPLPSEIEDFIKQKEESHEFY